MASTEYEMHLTVVGAPFHWVQRYADENGWKLSRVYGWDQIGEDRAFMLEKLILTMYRDTRVGATVDVQVFAERLQEALPAGGVVRAKVEECVLDRRYS